MIRLLGMLCILAGSAGIGMRMAEELELRVREIQTLRHLTIALRGEIRYMRQPLPEAFLHLAENAPPPFARFFQSTAKELEQRSGGTAGEIWKKNLAEHLSGLHISTQERAELERLGTMLGYLDVEMQVNALDLYLEQLKLCAARAGETAKRQKRLYQYMGALGGAALAILIF